jgi:hypothetical protein
MEQTKKIAVIYNYDQFKKLKYERPTIELLSVYAVQSGGVTGGNESDAYTGGALDS